MDLSIWVKWGIFSKYGGMVLSEYIIFGENNYKWDNDGFFFLYVKLVYVYLIKYFLKVVFILFFKWKDVVYLWIYMRYFVKKVIIILGCYCVVCS